MKVHSFYVEEAEKHGVEKAVILYNLRFWLEKNKANSTNLHDGYYWTYNSAKAFAALFPYYKASKIERLLRQMESDGLILSGNYNKAGYDRTKWYSMPDFSIESLAISQSSNMKNGDCKNEECNLQNCSMESSNLKNAICKSEAPIPDSKPNDKPDSKQDKKKSVAKKPKPKFDALSYSVPSFVKQENWTDFVEMRNEIKKPLTETACKRLVNRIIELDESGFDVNDSLDYSIVGKYQTIFERKRKTNNQVNRNGQQQSKYDSHKQSLTEQLQQQFAAEEAEQGIDNPYSGNVYEMDS